MVIVDLPPLVSGADRLIASSLLDGVVIVGEWGKSPMDMLKDLVRSLRASKANIIGLVMTNVRVGEGQPQQAGNTAFRLNHKPAMLPSGVAVL
ncbi:hypothetical protein [Sinorhizobium fredii]|uniref:hypothetical protein n=1 Tax=Rhizobium fredii TaxID=380 RepID=UPI0012963D77|nr:hypothetical protein [Sinorhizobium fredii]MQW96235.1 hypothetical protein [Sinorhizobium fredii]UTY46265.1 tyrosine-protein kinase family protein [Sinorhizobium fredii]